MTGHVIATICGTIIVGCLAHVAYTAWYQHKHGKTSWTPYASWVVARLNRRKLNKLATTLEMDEYASHLRRRNA